MSTAPRRRFKLQQRAQQTEVFGPSEDQFHQGQIVHVKGEGVVAPGDGVEAGFPAGREGFRDAGAQDVGVVAVALLECTPVAYRFFEHGSQRSMFSSGIRSSPARLAGSACSNLSATSSCKVFIAASWETNGDLKSSVQVMVVSSRNGGLARGDLLETDSMHVTALAGVFELHGHLGRLEMLRQHRHGLVEDGLLIEGFGIHVCSLSLRTKPTGFSIGNGPA
jgi:hypothetical protein